MRLSLLGACVAVLSACEAPPVFSGADERQNVATARIEGSLVVTTQARGNVNVFLFDAARPPPPEGTGRPITFTVVPREAVFGNAAAADSGPFTAPYAFSLVPVGHYVIRGFVDGNSDFVPWYGVTGEANAGDVGGAAVDAVTLAPRVVEVTATNGFPQPTLDVAVSFSDRAKVPVDRPVFEPSPPVASATLGTMPLVLNLVNRVIDDGAVHESRPVFLARLVDDDGDGVPDDANGDGQPDFWPRVVVRKMAGENPVLDENDVDHNGVLDATGADYEHLNPATGATIAADGQPDLVVLAAGFDFSEYAAQLVDAAGNVKQTPTPVNHLKLVVKPRALDATDPKKLGVLKTVPPGRYAVTVIQSTGQTWRVPNELSPGVAEPRGLPAVTSQSFVIEVP